MTQSSTSNSITIPASPFNLRLFLPVMRAAFATAAFAATSLVAQTQAPAPDPCPFRRRPARCHSARSRHRQSEDGQGP